MNVDNYTGSSQDLWKQAFPFDEARRAAGFLIQTWQEMARLQPKFFNSSKREDDLTERLHHYTQTTSLSKGRLIGFWVNENPGVKIDLATGEIIDRVRKDITYFSNAGCFRLELIFEFKKLYDTSVSRSAYTRQEGIQRFTDGRYGNEQLLAAMVGMVVGDEKICVQNLRKYLSKTKVTKDLRIVPTHTGECLHEPSQMFPLVASFDTVHQRLREGGICSNNITIAHFFLNFY